MAQIIVQFRKEINLRSSAELRKNTMLFGLDSFPYLEYLYTNFVSNN